MDTKEIIISELNNETIESMIYFIRGQKVMLDFELGKEISYTSFKAEYGSKFYDNLSKKLIKNLPNVTGLSPKNLRYMEKFYLLYKDKLQIFPQVVGQLFSVPWGHHRYIIDKCKNVDEALFFVNEVHKNNWSRDVLLNFLDTNLYKREGKAITNFNNQLPEDDSDLAQQIIKDPYNFDFISIRKNYDEKELKDALIDNIQKFIYDRL